MLTKTNSIVTDETVQKETPQSMFEGQYSEQGEEEWPNHSYRNSSFIM